MIHSPLKSSPFLPVKIWLRVTILTGNLGSGVLTTNHVSLATLFWSRKHMTPVGVVLASPRLFIHCWLINIFLLTFQKNYFLLLIILSIHFHTHFKESHRSGIEDEPKKNWSACCLVSPVPQTAPVLDSRGQLHLLSERRPAGLIC